MTLRPLALLFALASAGPTLPAAAPAAPAAGAKPAAPKSDAGKEGAELDALLDELALSGIGFDQRQLLLRWAQGDFCYCGCPHTVGSCLLHHGACKHSKRMVRLAAGVLQVDPKARPEFLQGFVTQYYAAFDRRAKIDLAAYGPPLGDEKAPVTLVVFSDFTCPYCQASRPVLEEFVAAHPGRVKLYFKPFPIQTHPGALENAMAGEWAREQGAFWKLHDALFQARSHDLDGIAEAADSVGLDSSELRDAVTTGKTEARVRASQAEGGKIGVQATPTLFMNGRKLELPALDAAWLEFALQDEEELLQNGGHWARD